MFREEKNITTKVVKIIVIVNLDDFSLLVFFKRNLKEIEKENFFGKIFPNSCL